MAGVTPLSDGAVGRLREALTVRALPERYNVIEIIGRGGMGVVWRAHDQVLDRDVAIKVLAAHLDSDELALRMRREARILAALEHPGVVPVFDLGVLDDGSVWYVMRLVRGTRLDVAARDGRSRRDLLRIVEQLCDTVAYAHAHGVVHRDLKPANVMLGPFGEVLVLDWGIAVARERQSSEVTGLASGSDISRALDLTGAGTVLGTPGFMSPEQAAGAPADERSDIFSLGAILRELIAAHPDAVPPALTSIVARACALEPSLRYAQAEVLRDDLRHFAAGERVLAHRETVVERLRRVATTYRTPILLIVAYLVMRIAILLFRGI